MKKYWKEIVSVIVLFAVNIVLFLNGKNNNSQFWNFSVLSLITFDFAALISFYAVQKISYTRHKNDFIVNSIEEIQEMLLKDKIRNVQTHDAIKSARLLQRTISNRLVTIRKYCPKCVKKEVDRVAETFDTYKELFDDNSMDQNLIDGKKMEFERLESVMDDAFFDIKIKLYDHMI